MSEKKEEGKEEKKEVVTSAAPEQKKEEDKDTPKSDSGTEPSHDPLKDELERVKGGKKVYTEAEKAAFNLKQNAKRAKELGIDPLAVIGDISVDDAADDDKPVTMKMLKDKERKDAANAAVSLASSIENETERELVEYHLENTIKPSGNAEQDFKNARAIVNQLKNAQVIEEAGRKTNAKTHNSGNGAPAKREVVVEFTAEELSFMKPPFNMTKDEVLAARPKA